MNDIQKNFRERILTYIGGGLGLVAGLAWNEAIGEFITYFFPLSKNSLMAKFIYALILTLVVVIVIGYLERLFKKDETH